jgi:hypothetical protein
MKRTCSTILLLSMFSASCGDVVDMELETLHSPIVFDKREAFQSRVGLLSKGYDVSSKECQRDFQRAMLVGAAASVVAKGGDIGAGCSGPNPPREGGRGSGTLISSSTLLTAAHVVSGNAEARFNVSFGTRTDNAPNLADHWVPDDPNNTDNEWVNTLGLSPTDESPILTMSDYHRGEESPLLAERLFQISFHGKAFNTPDDPSWKSNVDFRPLLSNDWPFVRGSNWWALAQNNKDLALLVSSNHTVAFLP